MTICTAQLPGPASSWSGTLGGATGSYLPGCVALPVTAVAGETVTIRVSGDPMSPWLLAASVSATQCLALPGLGGGLMLDAPVVVVGAGLLTQLTPCLSCPPAFADRVIVLPPGLPPGVAIAVQALGHGAGRTAFTAAILARLR